ncbi:polyketide synthase [uncultured Thiohalocapsa sp.]|uniref:polyketide synthase n=1 Tax=uncultured Thiohalocapsa sp. TaxID=768990 RepID=UPI0025D4E1AF|nr:polyketide synthase [uncultured Thiohalocapsa sp.]
MTPDADSHLLAPFAAYARHAPDAVALVTGEGTVGYGELAARAERIAGALAELGVGAARDAGEPVGLCMHRGADAVAAMLGILLAGGAYVPIDPGYPAALRRRMVREAGLRRLLTDGPEAAAGLADACEQVLTAADLARGAVPRTASPPAPADDRLFHVLYTSGSTATPKGVCGTHGQMHARLAWLWRTFPLADDELVCHKTALHFVDASLEVFGTLLQGRPLLIARESDTASPARFIELLAAHGATRLSLVVSQLRALLLAAPDLGRRLPRLRLCIVSGERLTAELVDAFRRALPDTALVNLYGCSEVPEISCTAITPDTALDDSGAPIGRPIPGTEVRIVDDDLREVAPGETGELLAGGPLLAGGYLHRPEETAARFIAHPFGGSGRLYRTGDRVRLGADGQLRFAGRGDDQVKVRGHRIELSAVEAAVLACAGDVEAAAAVVQQDPGLAENRSLVVFVTPARLDTRGLLGRLRAGVARHLVPQRVIALDHLPTTPSGKLDRRRLAALSSTAPASPAAADGDTQGRIAQLWCEVLQRDAVGPQDGFFDVGGDSLALAQLHGRLQDAFPHCRLTPAQLLEYPTIAAQAAYLGRAPGRAAEAAAGPVQAHRDGQGAAAQEIAVIGMACRFPGAATPEAFWQGLRDGVDAIADFSDAELEQPDPRLRADPDYVKAGAVLDDIAGFDADLFGYTDKEAALLDPQQRLLLECAWEAMERAGVVPGGRIGVYAGSSQSGYFLNQVATHRPVTEATLQEYQANLANDRNFLATRIAYKLALSGPAMTVQTACSTGLVVVHLACQALRAGECDAALAGAVALRVPQKAGYLFEEGMIRSPDGRCRAFDADAEGTLFGSGVGVVLLKPLARAQADGDPILAVIKGSAINNDAAAKAGFTAPSAAGQSAVIASALDAARVDPNSIGYIEAHGTGTRLGDPIEIAALTRAFAERGRRADGGPRCAVGSVKTNIGHLDEAAGIAGFIKTVLALRHREIPPSLHYRNPNPAIDFTDSPFEVNARLRPWPAPPETPRRAGVSSFGMGGTNCHLVLEEAPAQAQPAAPPLATTRPSHQLLVLSAAGGPALQALVGRWRELLDESPAPDLTSLCATAATGRRHLGRRCAVVAASTAALRERLAALSVPAQPPAGDGGGTGKIAFLFTGQGAQYANMARGLYDSCAPFRATLDRCAEILKPLLPRPLTEVMFCAADATSAADALLAETRYTQPALFAVEYALAELWQSWGIVPDLVMGHSVGEYVAACVAGVITLEDALRVVAERGRLIQALPAGGGMLAVALDEAQTRDLLSAHAGDDVAVAAVNGPAQTVVSGRVAALDVIAATLAGQGIDHRRLSVSHAFHSPLLEPMLGPFAGVLRSVRWAEPRLAVISNVTGARVTGELTDPDYWVEHTRSAVRFAAGVATLLDAGAGTLIEIGPAPTLLGMAAATVAARDAAPPLLVPSLRRGQDDWAQLLDGLGRLYTAGADIHWHGLYAGQHWRRRSLPTTVFQHKRCWIDAPAGAAAPGASEPVPEERLLAAARQLQRQGELAPGEAERLVPLLLAALRAQPPGGQAAEPWQGLLYTPEWRLMPAGHDARHAGAAAEKAPAGTGSWLILADGEGIGAALAARIEAAGDRALLLDAGPASQTLAARPGSGDARDPGQVAAWLQRRAGTSAGAGADRIVCLWGLDARADEDADGPALLAAGERVHPAVSAMLSALAGPAAEGVRLWLVTRGAQPVGTASAGIDPVQSTLWGLGRTFALEQPQRWGGLVDLSPRQGPDDCARALWAELRRGDVGEQVVLRDAGRYLARLVPQGEPAGATAAPVRADGAYLVTGGLGALGLDVAEALADLGARHLVLASRRGLRSDAQRNRVEQLRARGVAVTAPALDVADEAALAALLGRFRAPQADADGPADLPPLRGIVHAAGTIATEPSPRPDWPRVASVLGPKLVGGWALHRLSRGHGLDFFVLFSSASSLLGLGGHADYAAANAGLDALAAHRRQQGLPALSIGWGDWADTGMAAMAPAGADAAAQTGLGALPVAQARAAFRALLGSNGHLAVVRADWQRFLASFEAHRVFLADCLGDGAAAVPGPSADGQSLPARLAAAGPDERAQLLGRHLPALVAEVLGRADAGALDPAANLLTLGFDSLLLIELRNRLRQDLGVQIPLPQMLQGMPINDLAAAAAARLGTGSAASGAPPRPAAHGAEAPATPLTTEAGKPAGDATWTTTVL